jgi:hypothetical protein
MSGTETGNVIWKTQVQSVVDTSYYLQIPLQKLLLTIYHDDDNKIWKQVTDHKYKEEDPNIFSCTMTGA